MKPLLCLALAVILAGCAAPLPELQVDTGTNMGETGDPRNRARLHTELGALYFSRRNMAVALEELRIALAADPTYAPTHGMFGLVYMELRENQLAEQSFQNGLRLSPQDPDLNHNYAWYLCQTGRETESIKFFLAALRNPLYTTPWRTHSAAGTCSMRQGQVKDAEAFFERALKEEPDERASLLQLGEIRYRQSRFEDARKLVTRFNKLVEPTPESLWLALRIERKLGQRVAETSLANQLRRRHPGSREYQLLQRGEYD
ncbi:MAG: type IV pilus biogenesis/stability protein PilW [Betaproteobacteria bacterium RIFCSPLOWO2_02_FULL_67_19]|nr:MAG: type IV pilus biogenesis/stability protein PilW [Betaproteobacteria bacterium RIFCSPLOWO2_02_FULL_67_19]